MQPTTNNNMTARAAARSSSSTAAILMPLRRPPGRRRATPPALARARRGDGGASSNTNTNNKQRAQSPAAVAEPPQPLLSLRRRLAGALPPALTSLAAEAQEAAAAAASAAAKKVAAGRQQQQQSPSRSPSPSRPTSSPPSWGGLRLGFLSGGEEDVDTQQPATAAAASAASPSPPASPRARSPASTTTVVVGGGAAKDRQQQQQQQKEQNEAAESTTATTADALSSSALLRGDWWHALPSRHRVVFGAALAFVVCNMDKVNMSVAIIPMAQEYGWSAGVAGLVQSAFFWGYILCQLPGGYLSSAVGGRTIMPAGVGLWSLATAAVPLLAGTVPGLCAARAAVGLGEAVAPSAATDMVARIVPAGERSRAVAFVFGGLHVGSILGLLAAPWLIERFGWESVFVSFGAVGLVWCVWFERLMAELREADPEVAARLVGNGVAKGETTAKGEAAALATAAADPHAAAPHHSLPHIPYRAFLRSRSVQALAYAHFCNNWFHYTMLAWLPTYFTSALDADLGSAARTALLPPLAGIAASALAGPLADSLVAKGMPVSRVRKLAQGAAFLVPSACLLAASALAGGVSDAAADAATAADVDLWAARITVALITAGLGASSFSLAGLYCTHQDLSPKYSSAMLGLTNTAGAVPGIVGVAATGWLYDVTGSWAAALFLPTVFFLVTGAGVYTFFGSNAPEDFDAPGLDAPFAIEAPLRRWVARAVAAALPEGGDARARVVEALGLEEELVRLQEEELVATDERKER
jgi:ACS family sodium-dependent inorganic phosphate cotransporter